MFEKSLVTTETTKMESNNLSQFINLPWMQAVLRIGIYFLLAWVVSLVSKWIAHRLIRFGRFAPRNRQPRPERQKTIKNLIASAISLIAFVVAALMSIGLFVETDTLVWMVGLFSAAFGLGARPLISDYLAGISFIFEDTFAVGEKIELPGIYPIEGVVEAISLRTTSFRAVPGELYIVPNGEIRTVRNFSRGKFSLANITLRIASSDLGTALPFLENLGKEAVVMLPNLLEPWQVVSKSGIIGQETELTLIAKARFGKASEMRPRLLALVQERLLEVDVSLVS
jgi:small-conductance mechanosensitive channel